MKNIKPKQWHPTNRKEEEKSADTLRSYASKNTSFTLHPYVDAQDISLDDVEDLAQIGIDGLLPNQCRDAIHIIKSRQKTSGPFMEMWWKNKEGKYVKETHTWDEGSAKCKVTFEELP